MQYVVVSNGFFDVYEYAYSKLNNFKKLYKSMITRTKLNYQSNVLHYKYKALGDFCLKYNMFVQNNVLNIVLIYKLITT